MTRPGKFPTAQAGFEPRILRSRGGRLERATRSKQESNPGAAILKLGALTTRPTRRCARGKRREEGGRGGDGDGGGGGGVNIGVDACTVSRGSTDEFFTRVREARFWLGESKAESEKGRRIERFSRTIPLLFLAVSVRETNHRRHTKPSSTAGVRNIVQNHSAICYTANAFSAKLQRL